MIKDAVMKWGPEEVVYARGETDFVFIARRRDRYFWPPTYFDFVHDYNSDLRIGSQSIFFMFREINVGANYQTDNYIYVDNIKLITDICEISIEW